MCNGTPPPPPATVTVAAIDVFSNMLSCDWGKENSIYLKSNQWILPACDSFQHAAPLIDLMFPTSPIQEARARETPMMGCLFNTLFKPIDALQLAIEDERKRFEEWRSVSGYGMRIAMHIRAGDVSMGVGGDNRGISLTMAMLCLSRWPSNSAVFLATDSDSVKAEARAHPSFFISSAALYHVDRSPKSEDALLRVWVDLFMLSQMEAIIISPSGFSVLAMQMGEYAQENVAVAGSC